MRSIAKLLWLTFVLIFVAVPVASPQAQPESGSKDALVVGRISHVEGELLRYVTEEKDWVATIKDAPFGINDTLYSDQDAKAEIIIPNNTWLRINGNTQVQAIALEDDVTEIDVASGIARFGNKSRTSIIKATTPFGYVTAQAGTIFDLYVGEQSVEVIALKGSVSFIHEPDNSRYDVEADSSSIIADQRAVTSGQGTVDSDWDDWNANRDDIWAKRLQVKGDSVRYVPPQLEDDAYTLDENGEWETVYYEGEQRNLWRPTRVGPGWAPYTVGRWTTYYGDQCWVPDEPFGYTTHHYGSWVFVNTSNRWYWAPPVVSVAVAPIAPVVSIGFGWYPGRVSWIHTDTYVGWVPLAPSEVYYSHHHWGRYAHPIGSLVNININLGHHRYLDHAIVIGHNDLYRVPNYHSVRITNINRTTIINNYRSAPVVNDRVFRGYGHTRERYNFRNIEVRHKPHRMVLDRVEHNHRTSQRIGRVRAADIERNSLSVRQARPVSDLQVERPRVRNRLVPRDKMNAPTSEMRFEEKPLKMKERQRPVREGGRQMLQQPPVAPQRELSPREQQRLERQQKLEERKQGRREGHELRRQGGEQTLEGGATQTVPREERLHRQPKPERQPRQIEREQIQTVPREERLQREPKPERQPRQRRQEITPQGGEPVQQLQNRSIERPERQKRENQQQQQQPRGERKKRKTPEEEQQEQQLQR
ncbi:MAG: DUF6600 domain-containing protein [Syntrophobacteraceae bacterium]